MKKILFCLLTSFFLVSCGSNTWEYKVVSVKGEDAGKFSPTELKVTNENLNSIGKDGWELVGIYTTNETVHPNFGNEEYVSGLQPNVRTNSVNLVFKRKQ